MHRARIVASILPAAASSWHHCCPLPEAYTSGQAGAADGAEHRVQGVAGQLHRLAVLDHRVARLVPLQQHDPPLSDGRLADHGGAVATAHCSSLLFRADRLERAQRCRCLSASPSLCWPHLRHLLCIAVVGSDQEAPARLVHSIQQHLQAPLRRKAVSRVATQLCKEATKVGDNAGNSKHRLEGLEWRPPSP